MHNALKLADSSSILRDIAAAAVRVCVRAVEYRGNETEPSNYRPFGRERASVGEVFRDSVNVSVSPLVVPPARARLLPR